MASRSVLFRLFVLGAVTLCPFECISHKVARADYLLRLAHEVEPAEGRVLPPAPPHCQNESGCVCQGVIFIAPPQIDDIALDHWMDLVGLELWAPTSFLCDAPAGQLFPEEDDAPLVSGRMLRALFASFLL